MIEAVTPPKRSRIWTDEDAKQAYDLLTGENPSAAKYGTYPKGEDSKARTQGMALDALIKANHGRRFGVSVWTDAEGNVVGALLPREPVQRKPKAPAKSGK